MGAGLAHAFILVAVFAVAVAVKVCLSFRFHLSCAEYIHTHAIGRRNCKHTGGEAGTVRSFGWGQQRFIFMMDHSCGTGGSTLGSSHDTGRVSTTKLVLARLNCFCRRFVLVVSVWTFGIAVFYACDVVLS